MRAGLSTIQQTLTPEAASVLNHSIAEATRRNHSQTTPLQVAATLLASPTSILRQACTKSHPDSPHPLQCRALELCFSVALERLQTSQSIEKGTEPPVSNALLAALKRAQAHQRRGCVEQQQQPLLAVKVELEYLIISILDDPSLSRVMREARFSSPAVKSTIEQSLNHSTSNLHPSLGLFGGIDRGRFNSPSNWASSSPAVPQLGPTPSSVQLHNRNMYLNPRLQSGDVGKPGCQRDEEVKKLVDVFLKSKKRNPVLVGEGELDDVVKELFRRIEKGELNGEGCLKNVQLIKFDQEFVSNKDQTPSKIIELGGLIESKIGSGSVLVYLGDLRWLVEHPVGQPPQQQAVSEAGKLAVVEMGRLLERFTGNCNENNCIGNKIWLIGTATRETYLRCQAYHPTMENDWDLQAVPIASRSPIFPRLGNERILLNPGEPLSALKSLSTTRPTLSSNLSDNLNVRKLKICSQCSEKYEVELGHLEKYTESSTSDFGSELAQLKLPQWLQNAKLQDNHVKSSLLQGKNKEKSQDLQKKWNETCLRLHPSFHHNVSSERTPLPVLQVPTLSNPTLPVHQPFQPKLHLTTNLGEMPELNKNPPLFRPSLNKNLVALRPSLNENPPTHLSLNENPLTLRPTLNGSPQTLLPSLYDNPGALRPSLNKNSVTLRPSLNENIVTHQPPKNATGSPGSPVRTDLVLGRKGTKPSPENASEGNFKDFLGGLSSEPKNRPLDKFSNSLDAEQFKKLIKGLMEKAWWQADAASGVAQAVTRCRLGNGKQRGGGSRGDIWLLFTGPDRIGKRKMASVLSEQICGTSPVMICLGLRRDYEEQEISFRGKTALDRIAEAVRRNPFNVLMIEDIDEADFLIRGSIKRAIDRGRLTDSHGREISLGNVVFIVTGNWSTISSDDQGNWMNNTKFVRNGNWHLRLTVSEKGIKRRANWLLDQDRPSKIRRELNSGLPFDLNVAANIEDDKTDGSHESSDLTNEHEEELGFDDQQFSIREVPHDLLNAVDDTIPFRPVDFHFIRKEIRKTIANKFSMGGDDKISVQVEDAALDKIIGGLLFGKSSLEQWVEKTLGPSFEQLESLLESANENVGVRLELYPAPDMDSDGHSNGDQLPTKLRIIADGIRN